jgi:hypothetical protein
MRIQAGWEFRLVAVSSIIILAAPSFASILTQDAPSQKQNIDPFQSALVLQGARRYSQRLEKAALDFVCREETSESIDRSRDFKKDFVSRVYQVPGTMSTNLPPAQRPPVPGDVREAGAIQNTYIFDYQFVRQSGKIAEKRELLEKNGRKAGKKETPPETAAFQYADILLAPVRLLDERFAEYYDYRLLREDTLDGVKAWVLDVVPRLAVVGAYLGGRLWLSAADSAVLRIDWDPTTFGRYENILRRAKAYQAQPLVTSTTEFGVEKNGIRFPSVDLTEEAYTDRQGNKFVRAVTKVVYKDYKFFTVETETEFKK